MLRILRFSVAPWATTRRTNSPRLQISTSWDSLSTHTPKKDFDFVCNICHPNKIPVRLTSVTRTARACGLHPVPISLVKLYALRAEKRQRLEKCHTTLSCCLEFESGMELIADTSSGQKICSSSDMFQLAASALMRTLTVAGSESTKIGEIGRNQKDIKPWDPIIKPNADRGTISHLPSATRLQDVLRVEKILRQEYEGLVPILACKKSECGEYRASKHD